MLAGKTDENTSKDVITLPLQIVFRRAGEAGTRAAYEPFAGTSCWREAQLNVSWNGDAGKP